MLAKTTQKLASLSQANFGPTALLIILIIFMSEELIPAEELDEALKRCPEWEAEGEAITRTIEFEEYMEAIDFVNDLAEIVNEAQHFPEIDIRDLTVTIRLKTIDAGGVTDIDVELAKRIDTLVD
jgi:4a-hydroxytetrahydrobiopterin dehydratase